MSKCDEKKGKQTWQHFRSYTKIGSAWPVTSVRRQSRNLAAVQLKYSTGARIGAIPTKLSPMNCWMRYWPARSPRPRNRICNNTPSLLSPTQCRVRRLAVGRAKRLSSCCFARICAANSGWPNIVGMITKTTMLTPS